MPLSVFQSVLDCMPHLMQISVTSTEEVENMKLHSNTRMRNAFAKGSLILEQSFGKEGDFDSDSQTDKIR